MKQGQAHSETQLLQDKARLLVHESPFRVFSAFTAPIFSLKYLHTNIYTQLSNKQCLLTQDKHANLRHANSSTIFFRRRRSANIFTPSLCQGFQSVFIQNHHHRYHNHHHHDHHRCCWVSTLSVRSLVRMSTLRSIYDHWSR